MVYVKNAEKINKLTEGSQMTNRTYYIDHQNGKDSNNGSSASTPLKTYQDLDVISGDKVLFKRGSHIRGMLKTSDGSDNGYITYGAYGEGFNPVFSGSIAVDDPEKWIEVSPSVWKYTGVFSSEVCNLIFNGGESCGNLRWEKENLEKQGEWYFFRFGKTDEESKKDIRFHLPE